MIPLRRPDVDEFLLNLQNDSDYRDADMSKAEKFRQKHKVRADNGSQFSLFCSLQYFRKYQPAVSLYFRFVRAASLLLLILFLIQIPNMISNCRGGGLDTYAAVQLSFLSKLMKLSLANQKAYVKKMTFEGQKEYQNVLEQKKLIMFGELVTALMILGFLIWWQYQSQKKYLGNSHQNASPSRFTIFVKKLPEGCTREQIKEHFNKFASVCEVSCVKDIYKLYYSIQQLNANFDRFKKYSKLYGTQDVKTEKAYDQLADRFQLIKSLNQELKSQKQKCAFVSFDNIKGRDYVLNLHKYRVGQTTTLKMKDIVPKVQQCHTQPANLLWQNIMVENKSRWKQSVAMSFLFILVLFIGLITLFLIKLNSGLDFEIDQNHSYTYAEVIQKKDQSITDNFCYRLNYRGLSQEYFHLCQKFIQRYGAHLFISIQYSCVVVIINFLLNRIIGSLTALNKHSTKSQADKTLMLNLFVILFLNTALLPLLVQWQSADISVKKLVIDMFNLEPSSIHLNAYDNFVRKWYLDVGTQVLLTYVISFILCPLVSPFNDKIMQLLRKYIASRKTLQKDMNQALLDPEFDFNYYHAVVLASLFFCLFYSASIPLFYLLGSVSMLAIYYSNKCMFTKFSRQPTLLDHSLNETATRIIPFGLLLHVFMVRQFSQVTTVIPKVDEEIGSILIYWIIIIIIIMFIIFKSEITKIVGWIINLLGIRQSNNSVLTLQPQHRSFGQVWRNRRDIASYRIQDNPRYNNLLYTILVLDNLQRGTPISNSDGDEILKSNGGSREQLPASDDRIIQRIQSSYSNQPNSCQDKE